MYRNIGTEELKLQISPNYLYFIDKSHPLAVGNSGKVYYHRHIMSLRLNRWVTSDEHVHHVDENKLNNAPENLTILSNSEHTSLHHSMCSTIECPTCSMLFRQKEHTQKHCSTECANLSRVKDKALTREVLQPLIYKISWVKLGKMFGYSDNGIKKRARALGCTF